MLIEKFDYYDRENDSYVLYDTNYLSLPLDGVIKIKDGELTWTCYVSNVTYLKRCGKYRYTFKVMGGGL